VRVYYLVWVIIFITTVSVPAWLTLGYWIITQVVIGLSGLETGVAIAAHIGGFVVGVVLIKLFARPEYIRMHRAHHWRPRHQGFDRRRWR
jgi:membrane associated rhomboid family serine protease